MIDSAAIQKETGSAWHVLQQCMAVRMVVVEFKGRATNKPISM
jgi:hypothetical protein